jgi:hypothetical protein
MEATFGASNVQILSYGLLEEPDGNGKQAKRRARGSNALLLLMTSYKE